MTVYINTQTMEYPVYQNDIQQAYPNTSFPIPFVPPENYAVVLNSPIPAFNSITQTIQQGTPEETSGQWYQVWNVVELSPEQIATNEQMSKAGNKMTAENLLQQTDWTAISSVADPAESNPYLTNRQEFLTYRSQIRQIAINPPITIDTWPTKPDEVWSSV